MKRVWRAILIFVVASFANVACIKKTYVPLVEVETLEIDTEGEDAGVVGGYIAAENDLLARSTVKLKVSKTGLCSGTVIGPRHVLTAAHCVYKKDMTPMRVRFGVLGKSASRVVTKITTHPEYNSEPGTGISIGQSSVDIAVVEFKGSLPSGFSSVNLPGVNFGTITFSAFYKGLYSAGFGRTDSGGAGSVGTLNIVEHNPAQIEQPGTLLTLRAVEGKRLSCPGDSGGPLYGVTHSGPVEVIGVHSTSDKCTTFNNRVSVYRHVNWILEQMK